MRNFNPPKVTTKDCLTTLAVLAGVFGMAVLGSLVFWGGLVWLVKIAVRG